MIVCDKLGRSYANQVALDDISVEIGPGVTGLVGPNGAGKSTLIRLIAAVEVPTSGSIRVAGHDPTREPREVKQRVGWLPEDVALPASSVAWDWLRFVARLRDLAGPTFGRAVRPWIERLDLGPILSRRLGALSKGYRQRVALAGALLHDPAVLLLDEPTSGLDPGQVIELRHLIAELGRDRTVLVSSHVLSEIEATCDRVLSLRAGRLVADASSASGASAVDEVLVHLLPGRTRHAS
jgi:ABC-2 type transport system ATP-binding protein